MKKLFILFLLVSFLTAAAACASGDQEQARIQNTSPENIISEDNISATAAYHDNVNNVSFTDTEELSRWDNSSEEHLSSEWGEAVTILYPDDDIQQTQENVIMNDTHASTASTSVNFTTAAQPVFTTTASGSYSDTYTAGAYTSASVTNAPYSENFNAVFLGVKDYGASGTNRQNMNNFKYRFSVNGTEKVYGINNGNLISDGVYDYPIQNILKENYSYNITVTDNIVTNAYEIAPASSQPYIYFAPPVTGTPGLMTVGNFLKTALEPVGTTLYVFGGGWDWQDTGTAIQGKTIGVSPDWIRFFESQDENYTYRDKFGDSKYKNPAASYYPYGGFNEYYYAGLDCSGYVGWVVYNTLNTQSGNSGFVMGATKMARQFSDNGWGEWTQNVSVPDGSTKTASRPGDIMSISGHIWISLGTCSDGSVVILHSTPSYSRARQPGGGVQIGAVGNSEKCEAYILADKYMSTYFKEWYRRYPVSLKSPKTYFACTGEYAGRFRWSGSFLSDPEGIGNMGADDALKTLFGQ